MPLVSVTSSVYPGIQFATCPYFAAGASYEVSSDQKQAIITQLANFPDDVQKNLTVSFSDDVASAATVSIANPAAAVAKPPVPPPSPEDIPPPEEVYELTEDDDDLINIEVSKLLGKTVAEAQPILVATGGNPELPKLVRQTYLERVVDHDEIQKTLKEVALKLAEQI
jgi:hypothetical protein